jgi:hypothetical protein
VKVELPGVPIEVFEQLGEVSWLSVAIAVVTLLLFDYP